MDWRTRLWLTVVKDLRGELGSACETVVCAAWSRAAMNGFGGSVYGSEARRAGDDQVGHVRAGRVGSVGALLGGKQGLARALVVDGGEGPAEGAGGSL